MSTHVRALSPAKTEAGSDTSLLLERERILWGGGMKRSDLRSYAIAAPLSVSQCVCARVSVSQGTHTHTHTHTHTYYGTHSIFAMPANASAGTEVIPLNSRFSPPPCVGQEPDRTSGAPSVLPLKVQPPNVCVQFKAEALLDVDMSQSSASKIFLDHQMDIWEERKQQRKGEKKRKK
jgi:hypothetical protein